MSREAHVEGVTIAIEAIGAVGHGVIDAAEKRREALEAAGLLKERRNALGESVALLTEKQDEALALVVMAVGEDPGTHSGRNAYEFTAVLGQRIEDTRAVIEALDGKIEELNAIVGTVDDRLQELGRICDNTITELNNYLNGF